MEKIKVASLFCGCGGMDLGVLGGFSFLGKEYKENPFEIVYSIDNDDYCTKIYNDNFTHKCIVKDVRDLIVDEIPDFDMLIGGFPCQSFSISAQNPPRLGYKDERGMLFFEMVKILKERKPRFFVAENVKGILSANRGKAFPMIIGEFKAAGYNVVYKLMNASEYGVPQKRERVFIVGFREAEDGMMFNFPSPLPPSARAVLGDVIIAANDQDEALFFSDRAVAGMMAVSGRYRRFSPREAARIQSFPDTFRLDSVSHIRQYKAIGNAVPPVLMWHVVNALIRCIATA